MCRCNHRAGTIADELSCLPVSTGCIAGRTVAGVTELRTLVDRECTQATDIVIENVLDSDYVIFLY